MQTDEVEFELTPGMLETPSLLTPNIVVNAPPIKATYNPLQHTDISHLHANSLTSNPASVATTTNSGASSSTSSADVKVLKIEDELKQSLNEPRRPTPSPFQKISSVPIVFNLDKPPPANANVITTDDGTTIEIPSTADVVKELEALTNISSTDFPTKTMSNDTNERETNVTILNGDNVRYDSPPTLNTGHMVSPKKKLLLRSVSHTEPTSPVSNNNNVSQSHKSNNDIQNGLDDDNSMDDSMSNHFTRIQQEITHPSDSIINNNNNNQQQFKATIDNGIEQQQQLSLQFRTDQNGVLHPIIKQQPIIPNPNKRTFQQANTGTVTRANTLIIPPSLNEVTSSEQSSSATKRQRTAALSINPTVMNFRSSFPASSSSSGSAVSPPNTLSTNGSNLTGGSEDQRKKQIRDSNREAARRCRERRRQYIEQLEGNLEQHKAQIKQLGDKLARVERENTQLRAILSETKLLHPSSRLSINDSHVDYANVVAATGIDLNSESNHQNDAGTIQRNYINRNNL